MKKIDLKNMGIYTDVSRSKRIPSDLRRDIADLIYTRMHGIIAHDLAFRILRSDGEMAISEEELDIITATFRRFGTGSLIDALNDQIAELNTPE